MPLLGGDVEGIGVEAGAELGGLEVVEREEEAHVLGVRGSGGREERLVGERREIHHRAGGQPESRRGADQTEP